MILIGVMMMKRMAKKYNILNPTKNELLEYERDLLGVNLTSIMDDYELKIKHFNYDSISYLKEMESNNIDVKNCLVLGIISVIEQKVSKAGNTFFWIGIKDNRSFVKLYCNLNTFNSFSTEIIKNKCSLFNVSVNNGFISFDKCKLIENIPFKKGYIFVIHMPFNLHSNDIVHYIEDNLNVTIKSGNVEVYYKTRPTGLMIDPTQTLINSIWKIFNIKCTIENEEAYVWGESNKLIKFYEENGLI